MFSVLIEVFSVLIVLVCSSSGAEMSRQQFFCDQRLRGIDVGEMRFSTGCEAKICVYPGARPAALHVSFGSTKEGGWQKLVFCPLPTRVRRAAGGEGGGDLEWRLILDRIWDRWR